MANRDDDSGGGLVRVCSSGRVKGKAAELSLSLSLASMLSISEFR